MIIYKDGSWWHKGRQLPHSMFDSRDFYKEAVRLLLEANPKTPVLNLAVSCFSLTKDTATQLDFFDNVPERIGLVQAVDSVNEKWGDFTLASARSISTARSMGGSRIIMDRIAFGGVKELEELLNRQP
jgi:hypothetical protein